MKNIEASLKENFLKVVGDSERSIEATVEKMPVLELLKILKDRDALLKESRTIGAASLCAVMRALEKQVGLMTHISDENTQDFNVGVLRQISDLMIQILETRISRYDYRTLRSPAFDLLVSFSDYQDPDRKQVKKRITAIVGVLNDERDADLHGHILNYDNILMATKGMGRDLKGELKTALNNARARGKRKEPDAAPSNARN